MSKTYFEIHEDWTTTVRDTIDIYTSTGPWAFDGVGTPLLARAASESNAPGIIRLQTSASTNDTLRLVLGSGLTASQVAVANQIVDVSIRFRFTSTANVQFVFGLFDDPATLVASGVSRYMLFDSSVHGNLNSGSANGGTNLINTGNAASTGFRTFRMRLNGSGALATYQILDASGAILARGIHASNFVDNTPVFLAMQIKTLTAAAKSVDIDRITLRTQDLVR